MTTQVELHATDRDVSDAIQCLQHAGERGHEQLSDEERRAVELLYRCYVDGALRAARRHARSDSDARDVVHDVFLRLPSLLRRYRPGDFGAWLSRIVMRAVQTSDRRRWREAPLQIDPRTDAEGCIETTSTYSAMQVVCSTLLERLPDSYRRVVQLRVFDGYSHDDVARLLGISVTASQVRFSRALKQLRDAADASSLCRELPLAFDAIGL